MDCVTYPSVSVTEAFTADSIPIIGSLYATEFSCGYASRFLAESHNSTIAQRLGS